MKLKPIKLAVLITLGAVGIWIASCKKETKPTKSITSETKEFTAFEEGKQLALKIKNFGNNLEQAKQGKNKSEAMPLKEALENMELLINASHGFPFEKYGQRTNQTVNIQLVPDAEGKVSMEAIAAAYDQMIEQVRETYASSNFEEKGLVLVTLSKASHAKGDGIIDVNIAIGEAGKEEPSFDCWYYGEDLGMCDGTYYLEKDGGDELAEVVAANNPIYGYNDRPGENYRIVLEPQPSVTKNGNDYFINNEYFLFFISDEDGNGFTEQEMQLESNEMELYYEREFEFIYDMIPDEESFPFPDYVLVDCTIDGGVFYIGSMPCLNHENNLTYAKRYWVEKGIIPDPTPID